MPVKLTSEYYAITGIKHFINMYLLDFIILFLDFYVISVITKQIQDEVLWYLMYWDDIVLVEESSEEVNGKLQDKREAVKGKGLRISRSKTEYNEYDFR